MDLRSMCPQECSRPRKEASVGHRTSLESLVSVLHQDPVCRKHGETADTPMCSRK